MTKWEYTTSDDTDLDELGAQGWELVTVLYRSWMNERKGYTEFDYTCYFKRPIKSK